MSSVTVLLRCIHLSSAWNSINVYKHLFLFLRSLGSQSKAMQNQTKLVCFDEHLFHAKKKEGRNAY